MRVARTMFTMFLMVPLAASACGGAGTTSTSSPTGAATGTEASATAPESAAASASVSAGPPACSLIAPADVQGVLPSASTGVVPTNPVFNECTWLGPTVNLITPTLILALQPLTDQDLANQMQSFTYDVSHGSRTKIDGLGDYAVWNPNPPEIDFFKGHLLVSINNVGISPDPTEAQMLPLAQKVASQL